MSETVEFYAHCCSNWFNKHFITKTIEKNMSISIYYDIFSACSCLTTLFFLRMSAVLLIF